MKKAQQEVKSAPQNIADVYYNQIRQATHPGTGRALLMISVLLILLGLMGLTWIIPFPHLGFLGAYNQYINWSSVFLAVAVYLLLRISPLLSYLMLFVLFLLSYVVMQFIAWEQKGGIPVWLISGLFFVTGITLIFGVLKGNGNLKRSPDLPVKVVVWFLKAISLKVVKAPE